MYGMFIHYYFGEYATDTIITLAIRMVNRERPRVWDDSLDHIWRKLGGGTQQTRLEFHLL